MEKNFVHVKNKRQAALQKQMLSQIAILNATAEDRQDDGRANSIGLDAQMQARNQNLTAADGHAHLDENEFGASSSRSSSIIECQALFEPDNLANNTRQSHTQDKSDDGPIQITRITKNKQMKTTKDADKSSLNAGIDKYCQE